MHRSRPQTIARAPHGTVAKKGKWIYTCAMKSNLLLAPVLATAAHLLLCADITSAWDGFDAGTGDLVELRPDQVPHSGETVDIRNYDTQKTETCLVESVKRNARTVEVLVRFPSGELRTLVMEGR